MNFLKKAYSQSDCIALRLDTVVNDKERLSKGKYSFIGEHLVENETHYTLKTHVPYSVLMLERHYDVYHYLEQIDNWEEFYAYDEEAEFSIWCVFFMKDGNEIAYIISNNCAYHSEFGWV
jgi:Fe-S-cluster containining protein